MASTRSPRAPARHLSRALGAFLAAGLALLAGCNVFSPLAADGKGDLTYQGLLLKGNEAINRQDYAAAADWFARAKEKNPRGSEAYLYHAKAVINLYGIDYNGLNDEFECRRAGADSAGCAAKGIGTEGIPFVDSATTLAGIDSVFHPVHTAVADLEHILRKARDTIPLGGGWYMLPDGDTASDGRVSDGVARLDLGILQAVLALLAPLDLDGNGRLEVPCGANICPGPDAACREGSAYRSRCAEGDSSEAHRLATFKKLTRHVDLDSLSSEDVNARYVSTNPNDINGFLDAMQGPVKGASYQLDSVTGAMVGHGEAAMAGKLAGIVGNISDLNSFLGYMRYDDGLDNDGDSRQGGKAAPSDAPMVWHDFDKDGGIRFDYDATAPGYPGEALVLGHPLHRHLNPSLYRTFAELAGYYVDIARDTSKNSRKALMIKHCRDQAAKLPEADKVTAALKAELHAVTCTTYASVLKESVKPPARSDWVAGTPGVDEEMMDERDNDYDGLKDEDGRNAAGMDNDDDGVLNVGMIGPPNTVKPMAWSDLASHRNGCPDIDTTVAMPAAPRQRQNCVGSLEHRIHLAKTHGDKADSALSALYSRFPAIEPGSPNLNCLEDFEKLDPEYRRLENLKANDRVVRVACQFKHIWKGAPPANSEWTSGVFGVDEEIADGADNDGDGWKDEDLK